MLEKKGINAAICVTACLIVIGGWQAFRDESPQMKLDAGASSERIMQADAETPAPKSAVSSGLPSSTPDHVVTKRSPPNVDNDLGNLNDQIHRAFTEKDGRLAANLASKLKECDVNMMILTVESSKGAPPDSDAALLEIRKERLQRYERMNASCQTVPGDQHQVRMRLLELAIQQEVVGAATESFEAGSRDPMTLSRVVGDASAGDIRALTTVAMHDIRVFGVTREDQDAARYALKLASIDPVVGERVVNYLKVAESYGAPNANFDLSNISESVRSRGEDAAGKLRERLLTETR